MANVLKPSHRAKKQFAYRLKPPSKKSELLAERDDGEAKLIYADVLFSLLYVDEKGGQDIRDLLRNMLYALSQKYSPEEIKEILTVGCDKDFADKSFMKIEKGKDQTRYIEFITSIVSDNIVSTSVVGETALFADQQELKTVFIDPIQKKKIDDLKKSQEESGDTTAPPKEAEKSAGKIPKTPIDEIKKRLSDIEANPMTTAFIDAVMQMGAIEEASQKDINNYIATMLHGIGIFVPTITTKEVEELIAYLQEYMNKRAEKILQQQINHFERSEGGEDA